METFGICLESAWSFIAMSVKLMIIYDIIKHIFIYDIFNQVDHLFSKYQT